MSLVLINEIQGLILVVNLVTEENEIALLSLSLLLESCPPGDELE